MSESEASDYLSRFAGAAEFGSADFDRAATF